MELTKLAVLKEHRNKKVASRLTKASIDCHLQRSIPMLLHADEGLSRGILDAIDLWKGAVYELITEYPITSGIRSVYAEKPIC